MIAICARLWEVEAVFDGRLSGVERASWERHASSCAACSREWESLQALRDLARQGSPPELLPLEARRGRARLLELADASATGRHPAVARRWPWLVAAAGIAACGLIGVVVHRHPARVAQPHAPTVAIDASPDARWSQETEGTRRRVRLDAGSLTLRVDRAPVVVITPDGEIEDTGTTFSVSVKERRTERVSVAEGSVVVRLNGTPPFDVRAGGSWSLPPSLATASPEPSSRVASDEDTQSAVPRPGVARPARQPDAPATPSATVAKASAPPDAATLELAAAMKVFGEGRLTEAASMFQSFERAHAGNVKAEDAGYLRVVALDRAGRRGAARIAAREYVERYPGGFRRKEVEALAADPE